MHVLILPSKFDQKFICKHEKKKSNEILDLLILLFIGEMQDEIKKL